MPLSDLCFRAAGRSSAARNFKTAKFNGVTHRPQLYGWFSCRGCIDRRAETGTSEDLSLGFLLARGSVF